MGMYGKWPKIGGKEQQARPVVDCSVEPSLTVQSDAAAVDINKIMARFDKDSMATFHMNRSEPFYGDVSEFDGLQDSIIKVQEANELFMGMSAEIRNRFDNDPVKMIQFLEDEGNRDEAVKLGMVLPPPVVPVEPAPIPPVTGGGN